MRPSPRTTEPPARAVRQVRAVADVSQVTRRDRLRGPRGRRCRAVRQIPGGERPAMASGAVSGEIRKTCKTDVKLVGKIRKTGKTCKERTHYTKNYSFLTSFTSFTYFPNQFYTSVTQVLQVLRCSQRMSDARGGQARIFATSAAVASAATAGRMGPRHALFPLPCRHVGPRRAAGEPQDKSKRTAQNEARTENLALQNALDERRATKKNST